jgi:uncharacterized phage protein (TIGR01671 family)
MNNRQVKFRVWNDVDKIMTYSNSSKTRINSYTRYTISLDGKFFGDYWGNRWVLADHLFLQQYTGLKDKNGTEIYDGDIILKTSEKSPNNPYSNQPLYEDNLILPIVWGNYSDGEYVESVECWMFGTQDSLSELLYRSSQKTQYPYIHTYTIVGNIFETPEFC